MNAPKIRGKYEKSGDVNYFGFTFTWSARYIKDPEHRNRYVLDQDSVAFEVKNYPSFEPELTHARNQELGRIAAQRAKETVYP